MGPTRALIVGDSHANCIARSVRSNSYVPKTPGYSATIVANGAGALPGGLLMKDNAGRNVANPVVLKAIDDHYRSKPKPAIWVVSAIGGNHASRLSMFRGTDPHWTLGERGSMADDKGIFVPRSLLMAALERKVVRLGEFLSRLCTSQKVAGVIHVEAPPPVPSAEHIYSHLPEQTLKLAEQNGMRISGPEDMNDQRFRLEVWRCQSDVTRRVVEAAGAVYLPPPREALDADSFLAQRFWGDAMHASMGYGTLVLDAIERRIMASELDHHAEGSES